MLRCFLRGDARRTAAQAKLRLSKKKFRVFPAILKESAANPQRGVLRRDGHKDRALAVMVVITRRRLMSCRSVGVARVEVHCVVGLRDGVEDGDSQTTTNNVIIDK